MIVTYSVATHKESDCLVNVTTLNIKDSNRFFQLSDQELRTDTNYLDLTSKAIGSKYRFEIKLQNVGSSNSAMELHYRCNRDVLVKVQVCSILMSTGQQNPFVDDKVPVKVPAKTWKFAYWFIKSELKSGIQLRGHNSFQLQFKFFITEENPSLADQAGSPNDYDRMSQEYPDVIVKSEDGVEYQAHKVYLCRSPIMKGLFENATGEQNNVVQTNLQSEVLKAVLDFVYSGKTGRLADIPENLLAAADYYQLNTLKNLCEEEIRKKLTVENAMHYLQMAELHSCTTLKKVIFEFVKNGEGSLIMKTTGWATMKSEKLLKEMFEYIWSHVRVATIPLEKY